MPSRLVLKAILVATIGLAHAANAAPGDCRAVLSEHIAWITSKPSRAGYQRVVTFKLTLNRLQDNGLDKLHDFGYVGVMEGEFKAHGNVLFGKSKMAFSDRHRTDVPVQAFAVDKMDEQVLQLDASTGRGEITLVTWGNAKEILQNLGCTSFRNGTILTATINNNTKATISLHKAEIRKKVVAARPVPPRNQTITSFNQYDVQEMLSKLPEYTKDQGPIHDKSNVQNLDALFALSNREDFLNNLDSWIRFIAKKLRGNIEDLLKHPDVINQYIDAENEKCANIYQQVDYRIRFLSYVTEEMRTANE